jgi:formamidopyrimidine-DNA glycosylase
MPELPEIEGYVAGLEAHVVGATLESVRLASAFFLRTVTPPLADFTGLRLSGAARLGKRVVLHFPGELSLVVHPMVAGRLRWRPPAAKLPGKAALAALDFERGTLMITEQGSKKRAALFAVRGSVQHLDPGGVEPLEVDEAEFARALALAPHTLKRALCEPKQFSGIGNAWSDEILWHARLSPFLRATELAGERLAALIASTREVLGAARDRHVAAARETFPDKVTAFQPEMAVHGRFKEPCPRCGSRIERITRASGHDFHYCPGCQTGGKVLADRALSRLLKDSWPPADP